MELLTKNVFVKTGTRGCNPGGVITSEGLVLIDVPGDPAYVDDYIAEISKWGNVRYIINTEYHFDHNMTNGWFEAPVIASEVTKDLIPTNSDRWMRYATKTLYRDPFTVPPPEKYRKGFPSITFSERMTLNLGEHTFRIILLPGHTAGQTAVYVPEEKMLFASDNVSTMGGASLHDALPDQWMESLEFMKRLDVCYIATGHGNLVTEKVPFYLDQQISAIRERFEAVKKFKAEGLRLREAAEKYEEMFPVETQAPASEGFSVRGGPGAGLFPLLHLYQVIGGNTGF
jgi:cyclase